MPMCCTRRHLDYPGPGEAGRYRNLARASTLRQTVKPASSSSSALQGRVDRGRRTRRGFATRPGADHLLLLPAAPTDARGAEQGWVAPGARSIGEARKNTWAEKGRQTRG